MTQEDEVAFQAWWMRLKYDGLYEGFRMAAEWGMQRQSERAETGIAPTVRLMREELDQLRMVLQAAREAMK